MGASLRCVRDALFYSNSRSDKYPSIQFLAIINPNNGPGNNTLLDPNFQQQLPILNSKKNVMTLGYVPTNFSARDINDVLNDISTYASWSGDATSDFTLHGIFFDETPSLYSDESSVFMNQSDNFVKNQTGFGGVNFVLSDLENILISDCP
jgi:Spherulation-specific family 4